MKKTIYAIAALALVIIGCAKKEFNETYAPGDVVTVRAQVNDTYTKVSADNNGSYSWQANDKITIFNDAAVNYEFSTDNGGTDAAFTCTSFGGGLGTRAYYPASANHTNSSFSLDASFNWVKDACNMPMVGTVKTGDKTVSFKTVGAVIKLVCYNVADDARKLVVSSDSKKLSGEFTPSGDPLAIATADKGPSDNTITITFGAGHPTNMVFYVPVPTGNLGKLTFVMKDGSDAEVSPAQTTKQAITMARQHIVAAPALNCSPSTILWAEDFTGYVADYNWTDSNANGAIKTTLPNTGIAFGGANITYTTTDGNSTTKIYDANMAGGESPELLINKKAGSTPGGTFVVKNIPTDGATKMTLTFKSNNSIKVEATSGISVGSVGTGSGEKKVVLTNTGSLSSFDLTFNNDYTSNCRIDDFVLSYTDFDISGEPTITPAASSITIAIAEGSTNTGSTTFEYEHALDSNPVVPVILENKDWLTAVVSGSSSPYTLTVTAEKNTTGAARSATVRLRGTGVTKDITINQPNALVANPSVSVVNGNATFTASWSGVDNASGYIAYFGSTDNQEADPTSLTSLTPVYDDGTSKWSVTKSELTNGNTYFLYVKSSPAANYVSETSFSKFTVKPVSAAIYQTSTANLASWAFTSESYPANKTDFDATSGVCTESTFYLNGSGSTWNATKGYAFTAVTDIVISIVAANPMEAGSTITLSLDSFYNKASNAPMTGFNLSVSESDGAYVTTGLSVTSWSLSTSSATKTVTYTLQDNVAKNSTVKFKLTQTGKAGAGQGYLNNIVTSYSAN